MKKYALYLDDVRNPKDSYSYTNNKFYLILDWVIVRSYDEFVETINKRGLPEIVSFDHDLADEHYHPDMFRNKDNYNQRYENFDERTGYDCVKWLVDYCIDNKKDFPKWYLHTMNPVGKENMESYIMNYLKNSI